jgi:hypothetical protein
VQSFSSFVQFLFSEAMLALMSTFVDLIMFFSSNDFSTLEFLLVMGGNCILMLFANIIDYLRSLSMKMCFSQDLKK